MSKDDLQLFIGILILVGVFGFGFVMGVIAITTPIGG